MTLVRVLLVYSFSSLAALVSAAFLPSHHRAASLSVIGSGGEDDNASSMALFSSPPGGAGRAKARRTLKKRRKRKKDVATNEKDDFPWDTADIRPLVRSSRIEAGEDYWIDEEDLKKSLERDEAIANRKAMEGEIPKEKLRTEVVAPYKQNWIGLFSVGIVTLAVIINKFPELLQTPVIPIPDL
eukprot:CAMPEP_0185724310 /NCGR_PEP_ID=MMETSP1171-20130828/826_1 /TAXON_ID=374046 /ORGANISM="Helicotheca tamensis, Strain CCMP826" /LENGTH=183 /DNA_ID=CAMNT_0028392129 /DNA_START=267 /DNA_END=818 /DNA_ORIENTATION=+